MSKTPCEIDVYGALGCVGQPGAAKGSLGQPWRPGDALWKLQSLVQASTSWYQTGTSWYQAGSSLARLVYFVCEKINGKH